MEIWSKCDICGRDIPVGELCYGLKNGNCICKDCCTGFENCTFTLAPAPTLTPPNEWVRLDERLPEYNPGTGAKSYWVAKKDNAGNWQMKIAQYCDYGYAMTMDAETEVTWRDWDFTKIVNVTHWMPLPKSPKEDE